MKRSQLRTYRQGDVIQQEYHIQKVIGIGGFGIVYLVYSSKTQGVYAFKTFRDDFLFDEEIQRRFYKEAEVWVSLDRHPFIVRAFYIREIENRLFIAMEYISPDKNGINSLDLYLRKQLIPTNQTLKWAIQFCHGMEYAYTKGIKAHRDIKPSNILITQDGILKISDFGLAGVFQPQQGLKTMSTKTRLATEHTAQGIGFGTPTHMSPEQFTDAAHADRRSDIYSFGIVLYQLCSRGMLPFIARPLMQDSGLAESALWLEMQRLHSQSPVPKVDGPLEKVVTLCLAKTPQERYQTFAYLRHDLEAILFATAHQKLFVPKLEELDALEWNNKGGSLASLNKYQEALHCFDTALASNPSFAEAWNNKALALEDLEMYEDALDCLDNALKLQPDNPSFLHNKGVCLNSIGRFEEALRWYDKALKTGHDYFGLWANRAETLTNVNRLDEALTSIEQAITLNPLGAGLWYKKGRILHMQHHYAQAIKCFDEANTLNPQDTNPMFGKALCLSTLGEFTLGLEAIKSAVELKPDDATILQLMADIEESLGNIDNAILICERILQLSQGVVDERTKKIEFQITKLKKIHEAKQKLAQLPSQQLNKQAHVAALANLAAIYQDVKLYKESEQFLEEAIEITRNQLGSNSPYLTPLFNNLATVFQAQYKFGQAQHMYEQAIGIIENAYGPDDRNLGPCYTNLATVLDDQGLHVQAHKFYVRALAIKEREFGPKHPSLIPTLMSYAASLRKARLFTDADKCEMRATLIQQTNNR